jgi:hypothetical protein
MIGFRSSREQASVRACNLVSVHQLIFLFRCFPHVVNLAVDGFLAALSESSKVFRQSSSQGGRSIDEQLNSYLLALETEPHNRIRRTTVALRHTQRRQGVRNTIREGNEERIWRTYRLVDDNWKL